MTFSNNYTFEFNANNEPKPIRKDFVNKSIYVVVNDNVGPTGIHLAFQVIRDVPYDKQTVKVEGSISRWRVLTNKFIHLGTEKVWEPDSPYDTIMHNGVVSLRDGEFFGSSAETFIQFLFDMLEVDVLGKENSIFFQEFPKYFKYREKSIMKKRIRPIKKILKS